MVRWRSIFLPLLLGALVMVLFLALASHRQEPLLEWLEYYRRSGDARALAEASEIFLEQNRAALFNIVCLSQPPRTTELPMVHILMSDGNLHQMMRAAWSGDPKLGHEAGGDRPYFNAFTVDESLAFQKSEIALRGFGHWHHAPEKPSLRIKLDKDAVRLGRRYVELSRPEDALALTNWLPERVAEWLGVNAQVTDHVAVFLNNRFAGLYDRGYRPGEELALRWKRLPGTFFKGDIVSPGGQVGAPGRNLWKDPSEWRLEGEDTPHARRILAEFLARVDQRRDVGGLLDTEAMARWSAVMIFCGSAHADANHNQLFFLDSTRGLLEPVIWDANGFGSHLPADAPVDLAASPVEDILAGDGSWLHRRNLSLYRLLRELSVGQLAEPELERLEPWLRADPTLSSLVRTRFGVYRLRRYPVSDLPGLKAELETWVAARRRHLENYLSQARLTPTDEGVWVRGPIAVKAVSQGREFTLHPQIGERRPYLFGLTYRTFVPVFYPVKPADAVFTNAVTGQPPRMVADPPSGGATGALPGPASEARRDVVLGPGPVRLTRDLVVEVGQTLRILPGTRISLAPGIGIYSRGRTLAEGTPTEPIVMAGKGWACLGIVGPATAGTRLSHLKVSGGSTGVLGGVSFKGMVNVYYCPDARITDCWFGPELPRKEADRGRPELPAGDDVVNAANSHVLIRNSLWADAPSDALDLDRCTGEVIACGFLRSGNDGLDVSDSVVTVRGCAFLSSGDKGVSVGERSRLLLEDSRVQGCLLGVQVKDASRAWVRNCRLAGNRVGVDCYQKKWLFPGGGQALVTGGAWTDNRVDLQARNRSAIYVWPPLERDLGSTGNVQEEAPDWGLRSFPRPGEGEPENG